MHMTNTDTKHVVGLPFFEQQIAIMALWCILALLSFLFYKIIHDRINVLVRRQSEIVSFADKHNLKQGSQTQSDSRATLHAFGKISYLT